ncbi:DUF3253 domain-containing protein [Marivibrio halodurans]|uniref:DUF3253 domain-containing protein n=1 Tax=Marivibrio halodurans TaxID=2039722 RepID=A0A8J7SK63_9PROT|nr:DUF3253 domain-containing protein [Marivibrio halodurans]MBP5858233.1 DUF3253 domain-containing protein [Marivibrio halodurans]
MTAESQDDGAARDALDPVARSILAQLEALPAGESLSPEDAARAYAETKRKPKDGRDLFKRYRQAVKQQAIHLARDGRIDILRKGEPADPNDFKGLWRMRLKRD